MREYELDHLETVWLDEAKEALYQYRQKTSFVHNYKRLTLTEFLREFRKYLKKAMAMMESK